MVIVETPTRPAPTPQPVEPPPVKEAAPAEPTPRRFRPDIQGLRAVAVLLVVLYHAQVPNLTGGYVGVDVFFVISGFLITGLLVREVERTGRVSLIGFYARRARRLMLPAAVVVASTLVAARVWGAIYDFRRISEDALFNAFYALNYHLAASGVDYHAADQPPSPFQHFWSLAVEEQFYAVWPLLIIGAALLGGRRRWPLLAGGLAVLTALSLASSASLTQTNAPFAYFSLHTRAWELGIGALLAMAVTWLARTPRIVAALASWAGVAMIVWSGLRFDDATPFPGTAALLPVLGSALVIAAGCAAPRFGAETILGIGVMRGIGNVSYSWYLWHWPLLILLPEVLDRPLGPRGRLAAMAVALVLAVATYALVERPALRGRPRKAVWLGTAAGVTAGSVVLVLVLRASLPSLTGTGAEVRPIALDRADEAAVQRAIDVSMTLEKAPSNLTPALEEADSDRPPSAYDGCHADYLTIVAPDHCVYGDPSGDRKLVLFGDSHAQQWEPALDSLGKSLHWQVVSWTKSSCPIADVTIDVDRLKRTYTECDAWRERTLDTIVRAKPDVVVLSQHDDIPGQQVTDAEYARGTKETVKRLRKAGIDVTYILDTPLPGSDAPKCLASHLTDITQCARGRDIAYSDLHRRETVKAAVAAADARVVEPVDWFCTDRWCPMVVGNILVYRDRSHISTDYSRWLTPMLRPVFEGP